MSNHHAEHRFGLAGAPMENGRFVNLPDSPRPQCGTRGFLGFLWRRALDFDAPQIPDDHLLTKPEVLNGISRTPAPAITWLGHAAFLIRLGGLTILTDPFLGDVAAPAPAPTPKRFAPPALRADELPPVDVILVSHNHYDHLDASTVSSIDNKPAVQVVAPLNLGGFFAKRGYRKITELDWWQATPIAGLKITATPSIHFSRRGLFDANKTLWASYVIEYNGHKLFFAGDTAYGAVFKEIERRLGPIGTALLPIGAYEPRGVMVTAHVNPEEAVQIGRDLRAKRLVAMHWGSIVLTDEPAFEPPQRFSVAAQSAGYADRDTWVMAVGETRSLAADVHKPQD